MGRGPAVEVWKLADQIYDLIRARKGVFTEKPIFVM
jgi:hypothetical protein